MGAEIISKFGRERSVDKFTDVPPSSAWKGAGQLHPSASDFCVRSWVDYLDYAAFTLDRRPMRRCLQKPSSSVVRPAPTQTVLDDAGKPTLHRPPHEALWPEPAGAHGDGARSGTVCAAFWEIAAPSDKRKYTAAGDDPPPSADVFAAAGLTSRTSFGRRSAWPQLQFEAVR